MAQQGFRVVLVIRDPAEADRVRVALGIEVVVADLSSRRNEDGIEQSFAVNHLAPFQLNLALAPRLRRVVQVSAGLYVKGQVDPDRTPAGANFHRMRTYCDTKLANLMLVPLFARHWQDAGVTIDAVLGRQPPAAGAKPITRLAAATTTGRYYNINDETPLNPVATDTELADRLWRQARKLTGSDAG